MKLTKSQLKQIIKEELEKVLSTEAARKIGPKKSMERPMKHRARYYKYEDGTFKSSDGSIRPEDYKPIDERDMEEIVLDHLESLLIRDKRGGVHGPEKPSHGQLEFIMHLWKTGSDKLKDYDGNPVTDLFQMEDEDLLKLLDQIPGEGDRPGYGAAATGKRLKHRAPIEPTSSPGTWAENKTRLTKQQLKQFIKEELLQLELFDTGSAGDEVGGTSLEQKKKLCAERGGEWISDDPSGEYGHCSKAAKEELEEELQNEKIRTQKSIKTNC